VFRSNKTETRELCYIECFLLNKGSWNAFNVRMIFYNWINKNVFYISRISCTGSGFVVCEVHCILFSIVLLSDLNNFCIERVAC
jgi:hypothetical protein